MTLSPEEVGCWYFRLNGFLTIPNFVLHPDEGGNQKTDIDIVGVRFPYRAELLRMPMQDHAVFTIIDKPFIAFAEIKSGRCEINRSLKDSSEQNIHRLLRAIGLLPADFVDKAAASIYQTGGYNSNLYHIALCCLGDVDNEQLRIRYPELKQILWSDILSFIYGRFDKYRSRKQDHPQWDNVGKILRNASAQYANAEGFADFIRKLWRISESV